MKKITLFVVSLIFTTLSFAQVGVGTTTPNSTLDITASNPTGISTNVDGILIPRVTRERAQSMASTPTSTLIYINEVVTGSAAGTTVNVTSVGFYFFNGTIWEKIAAGINNDWALIGNTGTTPGTNFIGTIDNVDLRIKTNNADRFNFTNNGRLRSYDDGNAAQPTYSWNPATGSSMGMYRIGTNVLGLSTASTERFRIEADGDVGIGVTPDASAKLDISSTNRGLLIPRVALTAKNVAGPITTPATSLLIYNTATAGTTPNNVVPGYYYWNGAAWVAFTGTNSNDWSILGNSGTTPGTNFLGTTDNVDLRIKTNNADRFNFTTNGRLRSYDDGNAAQPTYSWNPATGSTMGMYRIGTNILGLSTTALERMRINATGQVIVNSTTAFATSTFYSGATGNNDAIDGNAAGTGSAVYGQNTGTGTGVYGLTNNANGIGVYGNNLSTGIGVYGQTAGAIGAGVFGVANVANGAGTYGTSNGNTGIGVFGNTSGNLGNGVYGQATGTNGTGIFGYANNTGGDGVYGQATQANRYGVWGVNNNASGLGVYGSTTGASGTGVFGRSTGASGVGSIGTSSGATGFGVYGNNSNTSGTGVIGGGNNAGGSYLINGSGGAFNGTQTGTVTFATNPTNGVGIYSSGNNLNATVLGTNGAGGAFHGNTLGVSSIVAITGAGNDGTDRATFNGQYVSGGTTLDDVYVGARIGGVNYKILGTGGGSVSTTMKTSQGEKILFAPEAPENWFFDLGEIELVNGVAKVTLDPIFIECISDSKPFKVFVQGGENTLGSIRITRNQNDKSFILEDLGGPSNGIVQYSIYAIWKGKDNIRFPELSGESKPHQNIAERKIVNSNNEITQTAEKQEEISKSNSSELKPLLVEPILPQNVKTIQEE